MTNKVSIDENLISLAGKYSQFIHGEFQQGLGKVFPVINPSTESSVVEITGASVDQVESAINSANEAYLSGVWSGKSPQERVSILKQFCAALQSQEQDVLDTLVLESGAPRGNGKAIGSALQYAQVFHPLYQAQGILDLYLTLPEIKENPLPLSERISPMGTVVQSLRRYVPVGVVAAIAAYNFPMLTAIWKVLPALVTGNTVVLRPSPLTPITSLAIAKAAAAAGLPPGVLNVVMEEGLEGGKLLTTHPKVNMIAFTGSSAVGKSVMMQAAETMKRLQLELGGKSAQIFLPDAIEQAKGAALSVCTAHAGQGCVLGTRIFVPEENKQEVMEGMKAALESVVIGDTQDEATTMGPVISAAQVAKCEHFVAAAVEAGGRVVAGGKRPAHLEKGYFFEPTIIDAPDNKNPAAQEEIFGPVVTVIGYRDIDHAVEMANDSIYGLSGYVFGKDRNASLQVAMRLRTGAVNVNGGLLSCHVSSGGHGLSGIGRERGEEGLRIYQEMTCLNIGAV